MVSSVKLFTSVDDGNEEEKEKGRTNPSSSSHSERKALRELLALVGSEEATLVEAPTTTTTRKPVLITTSAPRIKLSSQTSSTTKAKTQESNNFILQMTSSKEKGKINNNNFKVNTNSNFEEEAKMKPKDFLLKMMLLSQDTNSVIKSDSVLQPLNKAKVETKKEEELAMKKVVSGKKEAWQAVSSLTTTFERGNKEKDEEDVFNEEGGFGDNLQLIFKQDDTQQAGHLLRAQEPVLHVEHGEGEAELRMEDSAQLNLDSDFDSAQGEMDHQHHLEQVHVDFKPAVATSEYGSQWLPVFSPSHRVA